MWARVENGIVRELIDFDPKGCFTDEIMAQFVECPDGTEQGWNYLNGTFSAPAPVTEAVQKPSAADRLAAIEAAISTLMGV
jgi:hypothetical protein